MRWLTQITGRGWCARRAVACAMRPKPAQSSGIDTELLAGEPVTVLDRADGWAWVKSGIARLPTQEMFSPKLYAPLTL
mgnify:CR=1 FL=1